MEVISYYNVSRYIKPQQYFEREKKILQNTAPPSQTSVFCPDKFYLGQPACPCLDLVGNMQTKISLQMN